MLKLIDVSWITLFAKNYKLKYFYDRLDAISSSAADRESTPEQFISPIATGVLRPVYSDATQLVELSCVAINGPLDY